MKSVKLNKKNQQFFSETSGQVPDFLMPVVLWPTGTPSPKKLWGRELRFYPSIEEKEKKTGTYIFNSEECAC